MLPFALTGHKKELHIKILYATVSRILYIGILKAPFKPSFKKLPPPPPHVFFLPFTGVIQFTFSFTQWVQRSAAMIYHTLGLKLPFLFMSLGAGCLSLTQGAIPMMMGNQVYPPRVAVWNLKHHGECDMHPQSGGDIILTQVQMVVGWRAGLKIRNRALNPRKLGSFLIGRGGAMIRSASSEWIWDGGSLFLVWKSALG